MPNIWLNWRIWVNNIKNEQEQIFLVASRCCGFNTLSQHHHTYISNQYLRKQQTRDNHRVDYCSWRQRITGFVI